MDRDQQLIFEAYLTEQPDPARIEVLGNLKAAQPPQSQEEEQLWQQIMATGDPDGSLLAKAREFQAQHQAAAPQPQAQGEQDYEAQMQAKEDELTARMQASTDAAMQRQQPAAQQPAAQGIVERPETAVNPEYIKYMIDKVVKGGQVPNFHGQERTKFTDTEKQIAQMIQSGMQGGQPASAQPVQPQG